MVNTSAHKESFSEVSQTRKGAEMVLGWAQPLP